MTENKNLDIDKKNRLENIENAVRKILINIGEDINREGLIETPKRVAKMYEEILSTKNINDFDNYKLFEVDLDNSQEMILIKDIPFFSMCEHHMLPFFGKVHVAYIPRENKVIGLSKIPRLVEFVSRKLSVQEEITVNVAKKLIEILNPLGVAVVVEARHMCIEMRGINKVGSVTRTSFYSGEFKENSDRKKEFLDGIKVGNF
jgi:GTP cyclohydrolase I